MAEKQLTVQLTALEAATAYSGLKLLHAGHEDAIKAFGQAHDKKAYNATKRAIAKFEDLLNETDVIKGI